jgi:hypothetical protein
VSNNADSPDNVGTNPKQVSTKGELKPLEVSGITAVTFGTLVFLMATMLMVVFRSKLVESGHENWIAIGASGVVLGLLGQRYARRRLIRIARAKKLEN